MLLLTILAGRRLASPHTLSSPALGISGHGAWIGVTAKAIVGNATTAGRSCLPFIWAASVNTGGWNCRLCEILIVAVGAGFQEVGIER
jgi:hypothetical protein